MSRSPRARVRSTATRAILAALALIALSVPLVLGGCGGGQEKADQAAPGAGAGGGSPRPLRIVTTTSQLADLTRSIGTDFVEVTALMGPGIDPHLYKATAGDVQRLQRADIVIFHGLHLEAKMGEVLSRLPGKTTLAVADSIPPHRLIEADGAFDPHIWFDPRLWGICARVLADGLSRLDPAHKPNYQRNLITYRKGLDNLRSWAVEMVGSIPREQRVLVTAHDAFAYFGRAFGMEVQALQGISTAAEAGAADVSGLAQLIADRKVPAIFVESSVPPRAIEAVREAVRARGHQVALGGELYSDALGDEASGAGTYLGMIRHNLLTITRALRGGGEGTE